SNGVKAITDANGNAMLLTWHDGSMYARRFSVAGGGQGRDFLFGCGICSGTRADMNAHGISAIAGSDLKPAIRAGSTSFIRRYDGSQWETNAQPFNPNASTIIEGVTVSPTDTIHLFFGNNALWASATGAWSARATMASSSLADDTFAAFDQTGNGFFVS